MGAYNQVHSIHMLLTNGMTVTADFSGSKL